MAAAPTSGVFELRHFLLSLIALCYVFLVSDSATVMVTQEPPFSSFSQGQSFNFTCSYSSTSSYNLYWYRQLPRKTELQHLGTLAYYAQEWKNEFNHNPPNWLHGAWLDNSKKAMRLHLEGLQLDDTGLYLCLASSNWEQRYRSLYQAYFAEQGTQVLVKDPQCEEKESSPSALLLGPTCHKKSTTLVCLAQGFFYKWPLDVTWKRNGQEIPRPAVATEEAKEEGKCNFGIASRLTVATAEWREGYTYSCHASQGNIRAEAEITSEHSQQQSFSGIGQSLRIGQLIFLLLAVKSFAYGTILGLYTVCRKTGL